MKWIIGNKFEYKKSTLLYNAEYKHNLKVLIKELRSSPLLKNKNIKQLIQSEGSKLLTLRNNEESHFFDKIELETKLIHTFDLFEYYSDLKEKYDFAYTLISIKDQLLKLI